MKILASIAAASIALVGGATVLIATVPSAEAFNVRGAAVNECNNRVRNGVVANNQAAFNYCVQQQEGFMSAITDTPGVRGFCAGVREGIANDPDYQANPAMAAFALQMSGC